MRGDKQEENNRPHESVIPYCHAVQQPFSGESKG